MKSKLLVLFGTLIMAVSMMAQTPTALANNAKDCCTQGAGCCPGACCGGAQVTSADCCGGDAGCCPGDCC